MNNKLCKLRALLLIVVYIGIGLTHTVQAGENEDALLEIVKYRSLVPVKSDSVDINIKVEKPFYWKGEIPKISISGYNKTNFPETVDIDLFMIDKDGNAHHFPSWDKSQKYNWLSSFVVPRKYHLPLSFLTTVDIPKLSPGTWYATVIMIKSYGTRDARDVLSFKADPFIISKSTSGSAPSVSTLDGMKGIWKLGTSTIVMAFDDGTVTKDSYTVLNKSVAISKKEHPEKWGNWRKVKNDYQFRWGKDSFVKEPDFHEIKPGEENQKLNDCFSHTSSGSAGFTTSFSTKTHCFSPDGTFSSYSNSSTDGSLGGSVSNSKESGKYKINGNILSFTYKSGETEKLTFGFLNSQILIGYSLYFKKEL